MNSFRLSKAKQSIAALCMLFFVVYCSAGICTNLLPSTLNTAPASIEASTHDAHAHHAMHKPEQQNLPQSNHCGSSDSAGCEWSVNPASADIFSAEGDSQFFFQYMLVSSALAIVVLLRLIQARASFIFSRSPSISPSYPRLHVQKSVFLN